MRNHLLLATCLACAVSSAAAAGSCLVPNQDADRIRQANLAQADASYRVIRPCSGAISGGSVRLLVSTGTGSNEQLRLSDGDIAEQVHKRIGDRELVDIWPDRSILSVVTDLLAGRSRSISGSSSFEGNGKGVPMAGEVLATGTIRLPLSVYGWDPKASITLVQGRLSVTLKPKQGVVNLPLKRLKAGDFELRQAQRSAQLALVTLGEVPDLRAGLAQIDRMQKDPKQRSMQQALAFQEYEFPVNAVSAYFDAR